MSTEQSPSRIGTLLSKNVICSLVAISILVVVLSLKNVLNVLYDQSPPVDQLFQVMLHQENAKLQVRQANGTLANQDRQVVTVVFVGKDHGARPPQYVPRELVFRDKNLPMGHGKWVVVNYPTVEGIDYLARIEFRFNGELGAQRQPYPYGTPRQ